MMKKLMATSFLAGYLVFGSGGLFTAQASDDPSLYFYPAQKWTVQSIPAEKSPSGAPVCMLSNTFNNGYNIQFAGSPEGFTNINIDFRQPTFSQNTSYDVSYSVPGVTEKNIPTKAFKANMLVTDLRGQDEFSSALRTASVVDVDVKGNEFRFYLTGLAAAMKDYNTCIEPLEQNQTASLDEVENPAALEDYASEAYSAAPPAVASNIEAQQKPAEIASEKGSLINRLASKIREDKQKGVTQEPVAITEPAPEPIAMPEEPVVRSKRYESPAPEITKESARLEADFTKVGLSEARESSELKTSPAVVGESLAALDQRSAPEEIGNNLQQIEPGSGVMPDSADEYAAAENRSIGSADMTALQQKVSVLEDQISRLKSENGNLEDELKSALKDAEKDRLSVSSDNWNLERATMRYNESERQITRLGRELKAQQAQCTQEKQNLEDMLFDPQVTSQQQLAKLTTLEEELSQARSDLANQQRSYEERIKILEGQLNGSM
ncbi:MAG: hypothetical protein KDI13_07230 [Alphaproteobacteria bacterium]|nr:hypothetical protein [Alphaproteobacteria bacterium]